MHQLKRLLSAYSYRAMRSVQALTESLCPIFFSLYFLDALFRPESFNYGGSFSYRFNVAGCRTGTLGIDMFRTHFDNQFVIDLIETQIKFSCIVLMALILIAYKHN